MMTCAFSIISPVFLGCYHCKSQLLHDDYKTTDVQETTFGPQFTLYPSSNRVDVAENIVESGTHNGEQIEVEEKIVAIETQRLEATKESNTPISQNNKQKFIDPLSHAALTLNRNWLDFPFFTDRKTIKYLSRQKTKTMFVMRGLSGSGKSSIVNVLKSTYSDAVVCSADDYFMSEDNVYNFDAQKLGSAHGYCQSKTRIACQNGTSVVVIDNTNVKRWEMKSYLETAKSFGYVVVLVEPKTDWKLNPEELAIRNKHGVPVDVLKRKVSSFDHVIPLYYGWFLSHSKSKSLTSFAHEIFAECLDCFPAFQQELLSELGVKSDNISPDIAKEIVQDYYSDGGKTSPLLHCTSRFCGKSSEGKKYDSRKDVQCACGQVFELTLTGLVMTCRTFGVRVTLNEKCLSLFERPEESQWTGERPNGTLKNKDPINISSLSLSSSSSTGSGKAQKKNKGKSMSSKKMKKLQAMEKASANGTVSESKPTLSELVSTRIGEKKVTDSNSDNDPEESPQTSNNIQENLSAANTNINSIFLSLRNSGFARSAHITLKKARNVTSVETNFDILRACDIENSQCFDPSNLIPVSKGKAMCLGSGMCCVYLDPPIKIKAVFSGYY